MELCLFETEKDKEYKIKKIEHLFDIKERLKQVGVVENQTIKILHYNFGKSSVIVDVMESRVVLDKFVCEKIFVWKEK